MNKGMLRCKVCGQWYFSHKKLMQHLIKEHDYEIVLKELD
ncbi:hypothetical protein LCGC14_1050060 [marine sediment metagenome]|uniref:C2H2-type domain-containing protein n=1 Tax=marine sediment metagenome TaxID=412755 RepID=A0A0F9MP57_9ZZZZ